MLREGYSVSGPPSGSRFEFDADCVARFNAILGQYEGVHNYHNFSPAVLPEQMSAQRCGRPHARMHERTSTHFSLQACVMVRPVSVFDVQVVRRIVLGHRARSDRTTMVLSI